MGANFLIVLQLALAASEALARYNALMLKATEAGTDISDEDMAVLFALTDKAVAGLPK